jgi:hypothetical protein
MNQCSGSVSRRLSRTSALAVMERPGLEQAEQRDPASGEHDQVGLHEASVHFQAVGVFAGEFLVDGPDGVPGLLIEAVALDHHFVSCESCPLRLEAEAAPRVRHGVNREGPW